MTIDEKVLSKTKTVKLCIEREAVFKFRIGFDYYCPFKEKQCQYLDKNRLIAKCGQKGVTYFGCEYEK